MVGPAGLLQQRRRNVAVSNVSRQLHNPPELAADFFRFSLRHKLLEHAQKLSESANCDPHVMNGVWVLRQNSSIQIEDQLAKKFRTLTQRVFPHHDRVLATVMSR